MAETRPEWSAYCGQDGKKHSAYEEFKACPSCGAFNPKSVHKESKAVRTVEPKDFIVIEDSSPHHSKTDAPRTQALAIGQASSVQNSERFPTYPQKPVSESVRQTSMQKIRNNTSGRSQAKIGESIRTNVYIWIRRYHIVSDDDFTIRKSTEFQLHDKFTVPLKNAAIESLDDFVHNHLLNQWIRWGDFEEKEGDRIYLAVAATAKEGPTNFPNIASKLRTIKELVEEYFPNKDRTMHIILERKDTRSTLYEDNLLPDLPSFKSSKKEAYDKTEPPIKQESKVKKEGKPIKNKPPVKKAPKTVVQKSKRPPSESYETPIATRVKDEPPSTQRELSPSRSTPSPLSSPVSLTTLLEHSEATPDKEVSYDKEDENDADAEETPLACRTRGKTAAAVEKSKGKARP